MNESNLSLAVSRRRFIRNSAVIAAAAGSFPAILHAEEKKQAINAVIIGMGGRGAGAGQNLMEAAKIAGVDAKIVAVADLFPEPAAKGKEHFGLPADKCFSGFDSYLKVLEIPGVNYAILATPPGFRPAHFKAAVEHGKNVFLEKPAAVDAPGCRLMYQMYELTKQKNLKVAAGTQRRHHAGYIETVKRIQDGALGDISFLRAYWVNSGPIWHRGEKGDTDLERQIRNWYHYIWLCGDHIVEQHQHNIDVCNWIMNDHPVKCWGQGARQHLGSKSGEIWDHFAVEFEYASGVRIFSYCGQIKREKSSISEAVHGTKGTANPSGTIQVRGNPIWRYREEPVNPYVQEHVDLIRAIVNDTPLNETKNITDSTLTTIMGREAAYSGAEVEWDAILNSNYSYGPEGLNDNCAKMEFGPFRTLQPPVPNQHSIFKDPPMVPEAKATA